MTFCNHSITQFTNSWMDPTDLTWDKSIITWPKTFPFWRSSWCLLGWLQLTSRASDESHHPHTDVTPLPPPLSPPRASRKIDSESGSVEGVQPPRARQLVAAREKPLATRSRVAWMGGCEGVKRGGIIRPLGKSSSPWYTPSSGLAGCIAPRR